jgi:predicted AAA+ superfamily ATPase
MKPWREVAIPHSDVLKGTFQQAEFAADISAVRSGKAPDIYKDAALFFDRTYITEGMALLLTQVAQRLAGKNGEPVIQLQTAFGGGKTHTLLAVLHLATRKCPLSDLPGVASLVEKAGLMDVPKANVAVIDGTAHSPGQPWKEGRTTIKTLWGELAWQLGKADGFDLVKENDANGTAPSKKVLQELLEKYAPCVILMDELVAYVGQFEDGKALSGGTFESNTVFMQTLTEAAKLVPNCIVLASLPESELEAGSDRGKKALASLEKRFGRVQALWKPVAPEEAFEIVRRRLFEPIKDEKARASVCRAFADTYAAEASALPSETQEGRYYDRLLQAYPIHPEFFERLYEDWTTIDGFQRTRGVLKLMAKVIYRLWQSNNTDLLITPGSLPLFESDVRNEMTYLLPPGWQPVIDGDIDGEKAETTALEAKQPRFGQVNAARRVARTIFLGSAPSSVAVKPGSRGLDRARTVLGCLQPGQSPAVYTDALAAITDRLHYLNNNGERDAENVRYWFDTHANLRREMEDRKRRFDDAEVRKRVETVTHKLFSNSSTFDAVHVFTPHADVPDDSVLRLVVLSPDHWYAKDAHRQADDAVYDYLKNHGTQPRHRANRLLFVAPDQSTVGRLLDATKTALAWESIIADVDTGRLNIDQARKRQAQTETKSAADALPRVARECFKWLLCPVQDDPTASTPSIDVQALGTSTGSAGTELDRVCDENAFVIGAWAPIHLREKLKEFYWKPERPHATAAGFWEDSQRYLYLDRLKDKTVLAAAIRKGSETSDFFGTACGIAGDDYEGFQLGTGGAVLDDTTLLIEPSKAKEIAAEIAAEAAKKGEVKGGTTDPAPGGGTNPGDPAGNGQATGDNKPTPAAKPRVYHGSASVSPVLARNELDTIAQEVIELLAKDPTASVRVSIEITAEFADGASDAIKRAVTANADTLGFSTSHWEP